MAAPVCETTNTTRLFLRRNVLALLALALIAGSGYWLHASGRINALVEKSMQASPAKVLPDFIVRVVDEQGRPVPKFQLRLSRSPWQAGVNGQARIPGVFAAELRTDAFDVLARAEGFASTRARFSGPERNKLLGNDAVVTMPRGKNVELRFRLPQPLHWPAGLLPEIYYSDSRNFVRGNWQPASRLAYAAIRANALPDTNDFNLKEAGNGRFELRVAPGTGAFYVGIHAPGFLQCFERGPFTPADVAGGVLEIDVPQPAALDIGLVRGDTAAVEMPFDTLTLSLIVTDPPHLNVVASLDCRDSSRRLRLPDLAPGIYEARIRAQLRSPGSAGTVKGQRDLYSDSKEVTLGAGQTSRVDFRYQPFDSDSFRGNRTARIRISNPDGTPAANRRVTVSYRDERYGYIEVFSGPTPETGEIELPGLSDRKPTSAVFGAYRVSADERRLGYFSFTKPTPRETFDFHLTPLAGDLAPDLDLVHVSNGVHSSLRDFRGKVVCLEVWETGCGPCQAVMRKLNQLVQRHRDTWHEQVAIVPLSIDERPEDVSLHVAQRGWDQLTNYWSGASHATGWNAPVVRALVIGGVPDMLIIDREGRIRWRGQPGDPLHPVDVEALIKEALKQ
jgi:thiol-disulfide isomerase/thioredoxin